MNFNISSILITLPPGAPAVTAYVFVAADVESTDGNEQIVFGTNGGGWIELDRVNPISGNQYPTSSGIGSSTFITTGGGQTGNVGGFTVGTNSLTAVTARWAGSGLQGMLFAVRFASIRLNKQINGGRINAADQFTFRIAATSSGSTLATGTTTGTSNGPFTGLRFQPSGTMTAATIAGPSSFSSTFTGRID